MPVAASRLDAVLALQADLQGLDAGGQAAGRGPRGDRLLARTRRSLGHAASAATAASCSASSPSSPASSPATWVSSEVNSAGRRRRARPPLLGPPSAGRSPPRPRRARLRSALTCPASRARPSRRSAAARSRPPRRSSSAAASSRSPVRTARSRAGRARLDLAAAPLLGADHRPRPRSAPGHDRARRDLLGRAAGVADPLLGDGDGGAQPLAQRGQAVPGLLGCAAPGGPGAARPRASTRLARGLAGRLHRRSARGSSRRPAPTPGRGRCTRSSASSRARASRTSAWTTAACGPPPPGGPAA